jgi:hypothetical protein
LRRRCPRHGDRGPVAAAAELARALVIIVVAVVVLAFAAAAAFVALRLRQRQAIGLPRVSPPRPVPWQRTDPLSAPGQPAIGGPREVHLHFHGASAEDIAEALARVNRDGE